jgi:hypothetical protein
MPRHKMVQQEEVTIEDQVVEEDAVDEADIVSRLSQLGAELQAVATDKTRRQAKVREIEALLRSLKVDDFPELAESETIKTFAGLIADPKTLRPGETRNPGTLAEVRKEWSIDDCWKEGSVTFIPMESMPLIFNRVRVDVVMGEETTIPATHFDIYRHVQRVKRNAAQMEKWLSGKTNIAPDVNYMSDAAYRIKAAGDVSVKTGPIVFENPVSETGEAGDAS